MTNTKYPSLLNEKARVLLNFNRFDLVFSGGVFLISSLFNLGGVLGLLINLGLLIVFKVMTNKLPDHFFSLLNTKTKLSWSLRGDNHE